MEKYRLIARFTEEEDIIKFLADLLFAPSPDYELNIDQHYTIYRIIDGSQMFYIHFLDKNCIKVCCYQKTRPSELKRIYKNGK